MNDVAKYLMGLGFKRLLFSWELWHPLKDLYVYWESWYRYEVYQREDGRWGWREWHLDEWDGSELYEAITNDSDGVSFEIWQLAALDCQNKAMGY